MEIRNVVFDFGNVIIDWRPHLALEHLFASEAEMDRILRDIGFYQWNLRLDGGLDPEAGLEEVRRDRPAHAEIFEVYIRRIDRAHSRLVPGTCDLIEALHANQLRLFGLTNANGLGVQAAKRTASPIHLMEDVVVSAEVGLLKPEPEIFTILLQRNDLIAGETLFVDDSAANCAAAEAMGMWAHQFSSATALEDELLRYGLLVRGAL